MASCAIKRGFFILRQCGNIAVQNCPECGRGVCNYHLSNLDNLPLCIECKAKKQQPTRQPGQAERTQPVDPDDVSPYVYRRRYYHDYGYAPIYWDSYYDSYYDDFDVRAFHKQAAEPMEKEEESNPTLLDS